MCSKYNARSSSRNILPKPFDNDAKHVRPHVHVAVNRHPQPLCSTPLLKHMLAPTNMQTRRSNVQSLACKSDDVRINTRLLLIQHVFLPVQHQSLQCLLVGNIVAYVSRRAKNAAHVLLLLYGFYFTCGRSRAQMLMAYFFEVGCASGSPECSVRVSGSLAAVTLCHKTPTPRSGLTV